MNLLDYWQILIRRGWIMILLAVLAGGAGFLLSRATTPVYRSSQTLLVVPSRPDNGLQIATVQLLNNRTEYLRSALVSRDVIEALDLDMEPGFLLSRTTHSANRDNMTIQIDVDLEATSDGEAAALINPITTEWGNQLIQYQNELNQEARREDRIQVRIKDDPQLSLLRPNVRVNILVGALAGFFLGAVIVFVLEFLESSIIHRRDDLERGTQLTVLAAVPGE
jgi:capsular polysaccharide biosynthesis protein